MKCPNCNKEVPNTDIYCRYCSAHLGAPKENLKSVPQPTKIETKFCKSCGSQIPRQSFYCPNCSKLADRPVINYYRPSNGMAIAGFILSFFIPILGLIFGCIGNSRANEGASGKGLSIAAIVISIVTMVINFFIIINYGFLPYY